MLKTIAITAVLLIILTVWAELVSRLFRDLRRLKWWRRLFMFVHPLLLTIATFFIFNSADFVNDDTSLTIKIKSLVQHHRQTEATAYLDANFVLIDNATDKTAIRTDSNSAATVSVTSRKDLNILLNMLAQQSKTADLIVLDMKFPQKDPANDTRLIRTLRQLAAQHQLILAADDEGFAWAKQLPDSIIGRVWDKGKEAKFSYHQIKLNGHTSLPYLVYQRLDHARSDLNVLGFLWESRPDSFNPLHFNSFLPDLAYDGQLQPAPSTGTFAVESSKRCWKLEDMADSSLRGSFIADLRQRKADGHRNVVFIGNFSGSEDIHETSDKAMAGPVILYNIIYALHRNEHRVSLIALSLCYLAYLLMTWLLIWDALLVHRKAAAKTMMPPLLQRFATTISGLDELAAHEHYYKRILGQLLFLAAENAYLLLLIIIFIGTKFITGIFINGLYVLFYTVYFKKTFSYFSRKHR